MSSMTSLTLPQPQWTHAPKLRLVPRKDDAPASTVDREGLEATGFGAGLAIDAAADDRSPVLVAGCDPASRASVIESLSDIMPERTLFEEVGTFWEVLVRAPAIRMVVLSGELDGIPTESLLHMLSHRHPELTVVSLDASVSGADVHAAHG